MGLVRTNSSRRHHALSFTFFLFLCLSLSPFFTLALVLQPMTIGPKFPALSSPYRPSCIISSLRTFCLFFVNEKEALIRASVDLWKLLDSQSLRYAVKWQSTFRGVYVLCFYLFFLCSLYRLSLSLDASVLMLLLPFPHSLYFSVGAESDYEGRRVQTLSSNLCALLTLFSKLVSPSALSLQPVSRRKSRWSCVTCTERHGVSVSKTTKRIQSFSLSYSAPSVHLLLCSPWFCDKTVRVVDVD